MKKEVITVVGLGYVGLPLALAFGKKYKTYGLDIDKNKIASYQNGIDPAREMTPEKFEDAIGIRFTTDPGCICESKFIIMCIPTPVDKDNKPDLSLLEKATEDVALLMNEGSIIIYESTVAPGTTMEVCVPLIEKTSGFKHKEGFNVAYSPERINPGDVKHTLENIVKVVSGDTTKTRKQVYMLYESIIKAGVFPAASIEVAEAAKVIENIQRDVNIALMNELALLFSKMNIDIYDVLNAAKTKWNFLPFEPGLVGGHCIGVDPFYLAHKAIEIGFDPKLILAGRTINDSVSQKIADNLKFRTSLRSDCQTQHMNIGIFGVTFKNDCSDLRNSKVFDIVKALEKEGYNIFLCDPVADSKEVFQEYGYHLTPYSDLPSLHGIIIAVKHREYQTVPLEYFTSKIDHMGCIFDIKAILNKREVEKQQISYERF